MNTLLPILKQIEIASPCPARWEDMAGDDRVRYCRGCDKNVYNFSAMSAAEVVTIVREKEGRLCARFCKRDDGTVLTADCPVGVHHRVRGRRRLAGVAAAAASLFISGCLDDPEGGAARARSNRLSAPKERPAVAGGLKPIQIPLPSFGPVPREVLGDVCFPLPQALPPDRTPVPEQGPPPRVLR